MFFKRKKITEVIEESKKAESIPSTEVDQIWQSLINPERAIEVKSWFMKNQLTGSLLRGQNGETMLHWAALSEYALIIDLLDYIDINCLDKNNKTPMDWILDRYNYVINNRKELSNINEEGLQKIKDQTEHLGVLVLSLGGRPYQLLDKNNEEKEPAKHFGVKACFGGLWWLFRGLYECMGKDVLVNWLDDKRSILHLWFQAPYNEQKNDYYKIMIKNFGLDINIEDLNHRTPLWYAIDGFFYSKYILLENTEEKEIFKSIEALLKLGADPNIADINGIDPIQILNNYEKKIELIVEKLKEYIELSDPILKDKKNNELKELNIIIKEENIDAIYEKYNELLVDELPLDIKIIKFVMESTYGSK